MRILITSPVFPPDLGGPAVYVPSAARFFVDAGHEVEVLAFCSRKEVTGYPIEVPKVVPETEEQKRRFADAERRRAQRKAERAAGGRNHP